MNIQQCSFISNANSLILQSCDNLKGYGRKALVLAKEKATSVAQHYPRTGCVKNIAIGVLFGIARIYANKFLFPATVATTATTATHPAIMVIYSVFRCIIVPIGEEIFFRDRILVKILSKVEEENWGTKGKILGVAESALIFGAIHAFYPGRNKMDRFLSSTVGGLFYGVERIITGNIWASTVSHIMHNANGVFQII